MVPKKLEPKTKPDPKYFNSSYPESEPEPLELKIYLMVTSVIHILLSLDDFYSKCLIHAL